jgi:hypothetical protein
VDYNAPTLWGTIGTLGSVVDAALANGKDPASDIAIEVRRAMRPCQELILEVVSKKTAALEIRLNKIKQFALKHLQCTTDECFEDMKMERFGKEGAPPPSDDTKAHDESKPKWVEEVIKSFEPRIEDLSTRLSRVTLETDEQAIKFAGLGFRLMRDASAWLMIHLPSHHCGLIVDVHIVMEHIQVQSFGQDSIKTLESLIKLKIKTMADGVAMTSFEQKILSFFKKAMTHKVIKDDASYFDTILNFEEWDAPGSGFRVQLKSELVSFRFVPRTWKILTTPWREIPLRTQWLPWL